MKISRFYQKSQMQVGNELELSSANHRHAIQVLRLKLNEEMVLFNGEGGEYLARVISSDKRNSCVILDSFSTVNRESPLSTTLALATIKPDKMDFAIQKSVELGVSAIQPLYTKRSVIKIKKNRLDKKMQHWQGIIIAACEQSGRTKLPDCYEPVDIDIYLKDSLNTQRIAMLPGNNSKITALKRIDESQGVSLIVGPEGGFTNDEEQKMITEGVIAISFGNRILRAETAAISGLTACQQRWGDL